MVGYQQEQRYLLFLDMQEVEPLYQVIKSVIRVGDARQMTRRRDLIVRDACAIVSECDKLGAVDRGRISEVKARVKPLGIPPPRTVERYVGSHLLQA